MAVLFRLKLLRNSRVFGGAVMPSARADPAKLRVRAKAMARAAILVLIDMRNSIRLWADRCGPCAQLDGPCSIPVRFAVGEIACLRY